MTNRFECDDGVHQADCRICAVPFTFVKPARGPSPQCCGSECKKQRAKSDAARYRAEGRPYTLSRPGKLRKLRQFVCKECGNLFEKRQNVASYCGAECRGAAVSRALKALSEAKKGQQSKKCPSCGRLFIPCRPNSRQKKAGYEQRYCSRECNPGLARVHASRKDAKAAYRARAASRLPPKKCIDCGGNLHKRGLTYCELCNPKNKRPSVEKIITDICGACGSEFRWIYPGKGPGSKSYCGKECEKELQKAQKKAARVRRKRRIRLQAVELVVPRAVFARDGWRCKLCGVRTPEKLRGTIEPTAPELDHIVPLAAGGEHSYRNTQCLCRSCNAAKSDGPGGQLLLFG